MKYIVSTCYGKLTPDMDVSEEQNLQQKFKNSKKMKNKQNLKGSYLFENKNL